jgi:hypothetical protein
MRYIPLKEHHPDPAWVADAQVLIKELEDAVDMDARKKIIDDNSAFWGKIKQWLLDLSQQKCWFSEARDCFSHWDVEHFRPKKSALDKDGSKTDGYWWLAFDWTNFRICGNAGNRKKGTYFPVRSGTNRVAFGGDVRFEDPMLLDPTDVDDPNLLSFNFEGHAIASAGANTDWERERAVYSIERYNLNFPALIDERKLVWSECANRISEYLSELDLYQRDPNNVIARDRYKQSAKAIRELLKEKKQFSSVARACVLSMNVPRLECLLQSA